MNSSFSMPNLPGMVPNTKSWIYRERDGFQKTFTSDPKRSRPTSAFPQKPAGTTNGFNMINNADTGYVRPSTAASDRLTRSVENLKTFTALQQQQRMSVSHSLQLSRPQTAVPLNYASSGNLTNQYQNNEQSQQLYSKPFDYNNAFTPEFVEKDKQVLRFYVHFYQSRNWEQDGPLGEPLIERHQCRRMTIYYYLIDDTLEIVEPKAPNTGMPSGTFFRRGKLPVGANDDVQITDFAPGNTVRLLGQDFFVTDADAYTRDYFKREYNMILPPALNRPAEIRKDLGAQYATGLGAVLPTLNKGNNGTRSTDYLSTRETLDKTRRFMDNAGKELRFQCVEVKGPHPPYFPDLILESADSTAPSDLLNSLRDTMLCAPSNAKRYALCYYLTTNCVELVVQKVKGEKKGNQGLPSLILKKSRLPKNWRDVQKGRNPEYFDVGDFACGTVIDVFGRYFLLVNCDNATRRIYRDMGVEQRDVPLVDVPEVKIIQPIPQLGDGFLPIGSNEDTLATVYGMPKAGRDVQKIQRNQGKFIRCKAVLLTSNSIDTSREFLISFFLEDDTIQVYEDVKRNSGIWGGNFLKRGKYINDLPPNKAAPRFFIPSDIFLGNIISFHGNEFQIIEMDNMSLYFCENYPDEFPMMDTFRIIDAMVEKISEMQLDIRPIFTSVDKPKKHYLKQDLFIQQMDSLGLIEDLNDQELLTLLRRFQDGDSCLYGELCDMFSYVWWQKANAHLKSPHRRKQNEPGSLKEFLEVSRSKQNQWRRTLRKDPFTLKGYVTLSVLIKIFAKFGLTMSDAVQREVYDKYHVNRQKAGPIWKELELIHGTRELFVGFDHKINEKAQKKSPKAGHQTHARNGSHQNLNSHVSSYSSVLRKSVNSSNASLEDGSSNADGSVFFDASQTLIDFHQLCDDIYVADWF